MWERGREKVGVWADGRVGGKCHYALKSIYKIHDTCITNTILKNK